jgi:hypothetical protein
MPGRDARKVGNMSDEYNAETCIMLNCRPTKFAALDEDWVRMGCSCPTLAALLLQWVHSEQMTLKDVAKDYAKRRFVNVESLLRVERDFVGLEQLKAQWPQWREESPNIEDSEQYVREEALRVCQGVYELWWKVFHRALRFRERLRPGLVLTGKRTTPPLS